jgi:hypothetical protein
MSWSVGEYYQEFRLLRSKFKMLMNIKLLVAAIELSSLLMIRKQNNACHVLKKIPLLKVNIHFATISKNFYGRMLNIPLAMDAFVFPVNRLVVSVFM